MDFLRQHLGQHGQRRRQRRLVSHVELGIHAVQLIPDRGRRYAMPPGNVLVTEATGRKPRVLFILSHSATVQVAGEKTAADAMLRLVGAQNVMGGLNGGFSGYRPMTAEAMAAAAPDLILTTTQGIEAQGGLDKFWSRPELALTPAFRTKALVHLDALELLGFGPRLPTTVRSLHQKLVLRA